MTSRVRAVLLSLGVATLLVQAPLGARAAAASAIDAAARYVDRTRLMRDVETLAATVFEGRRTDTPGGLKARRWLIDQFRAIGLTPAGTQEYAQPFTFAARDTRAVLPDGRPVLADYAAASGLELVIENTNAYFDGVPDEVAADDIDWSERNLTFGASPEEWIQIALDVDRPNVGLCLDSSHTCTYAHTFADHERRREVVMAFVSRPELIRHVHWNDNYLYDTRGRNDSHAVLGRGTLPLDMHRAIKSLDATIVIEHFYSVEDLEEELDFIERL